MKFLHPLFLLGVVSTSQAWSIDDSCKCLNGKNYFNEIKDAMEEAIEILKDGADVAKLCVPPVRKDKQPQWARFLCHNMKMESTILQDFFLAEDEVDTDGIKAKRGDGGDGGDGDDSCSSEGDVIEKGLTDNRLTTIYHKIATALEPASTAAGSFSETPDEKVTIVCGDSHLNKISNEVWKDPKRPGEGLKMNPPPADGKRPCSATDAVVYSAQGGKVMMLCDERPSALLNPTRSMPTISWARKYLELKNKEFDRFNVHLSSGLTHELIHLGDGKRFTRVLTEPGQDPRLEEYSYNGAKKLRSLDNKWKNCDTFAMLARALWLNYYRYIDGKFYRLERNIPRNRPGLEKTK